MSERKDNAASAWSEGTEEDMEMATLTQHKNLDSQESFFVQEEPRPPRDKTAKYSTVWLAVNLLLIGLTLFICLLNGLKIPYYYTYLPATNVTYDPARCEPAATNGTLIYDPDSPSEDKLWCQGMEGGVIFKGIGFRGLKTRTDPEAFLGPHAAMGILLLAMWNLTLLGAIWPEKFPNRRDLVWFFFPLLVVFLIHIMPVTAGIPNEQTGAPINEFGIIMGLIACVLGIGAHHYWDRHKYMPKVYIAAWFIAVVDLLAAPMLDMNAARGIFMKRLSDGVWPESAGGDVPHVESGQGTYAACGCGNIGAMVSFGMLITIPLFFAGRHIQKKYPRFAFAHYFDGKQMKNYYASERIKLTYRCGFRLPGAFLLLFFALAVGVGLVLTMTSTRFDSDSDFVRVYFKTFNPCIVFDHYPAKLWSMMFVSFMAVMGFVWAGTLWLWLFGKKHLQSLLYGTLVLSVHIWYLLQFINIFAYDLYDEAADDAHYGVQNGTLTPEQIQVVAGHTTPYMNLIFADTLLMVYQVNLVMRFEKPSWKKYGKLFAMLFLMMCVFATYVRLMGYVYWENTDIKTKEAEDSYVMTLAFLAEGVKSSIWSVVGQLGYRLAFNPEWKVRVQFSNQAGPYNYSMINPDQLFTICFRFLMCIVILIYMFGNPASEDEMGSEFGGNAFVTKPGVLIFAPAMTFLTVGFGISMWLNHVRQKMWKNSKAWPAWRVYSCAALSTLFVLNVAISPWRILPEVTWTSRLDYPLFLFFAMWSLLSHAKNPQSTIYNLTVGALFFFGFLHYGFRTLALVMLCFYDRGVGNCPPMYMKIVAEGGDDSPTVFTMTSDTKKAD